MRLDSSAMHAHFYSRARAPTKPGLRQAEPLPRDDRGAGEVVPPLETPDGLARVAAVVRRRDRPDRVGRADDVGLRLPRASGRACIGPDEECDRRREDEESWEHVFDPTEQVFGLSTGNYPFEGEVRTKTSALLSLQAVKSYSPGSLQT